MSIHCPVVNKQCKVFSHYVIQLGLCNSFSKSSKLGSLTTTLHSRQTFRAVLCLTVSQGICSHYHRCKNVFFYVFLSRARFYVFNVFYFANVFYFYHQRTDLGGIMSITSVFTIGPFVPCTPLCKIPNTPVMSICLVKQNDGTWVEKHQRFLFNVYKHFLFVSRLYVF